MQRVTASNYKTEVVKKENTCLNKQLCTCANETKETNCLGGLSVFELIVIKLGPFEKPFLKLVLRV